MMLRKSKGEVKLSKNLGRRGGAGWRIWVRVFHGRQLPSRIVKAGFVRDCIGDLASNLIW